MKYIVHAITIAASIMTSNASIAENRFSVGVEGFRDNYQEKSIQVDTHAKYGAVTASYGTTYPNVFSIIEGRASYGSEDYKSPSGTIDNAPQYEYELRARGGFRFAFLGGKLNPYIGLGLRYYYDESKGEITNLGYYGYDRRIFHAYVPVGAKYEYTAGNWSFEPTIEFDSMFLGRVHTRLNNLGGDNITNEQRSGYGLRAEFMIGQHYDGYSWQAGPFVRYWKISRSNTTYDSFGYGWYEPENERLQAGGALRVLF